MCDVITVVLSHIEIAKFREIKEKQYFRLIKKVAEFELEFSKIVKLISINSLLYFGNMF